MKMDEKATFSTVVIVIASMIVAMSLSIAFGFFAGIAGMIFSIVLFLMLDSIDESLSMLASAKAADSLVNQKKPAETYTDKGEKVEVKA
ncbi:MAG: hypothetical protein Q7S83_00765 [bacterium]|nr:hypothetical protein [bacterium]